jgi:hypothetical protein
MKGGKLSVLFENVDQILGECGSNLMGNGSDLMGN